MNRTRRIIVTRQIIIIGGSIIILAAVALTNFPVCRAKGGRGETGPKRSGASPAGRTDPGQSRKGRATKKDLTTHLNAIASERKS